MSKVYVGIDETGLGIGQDSLLVVAAVTADSRLAENRGYRTLKKSRDRLEAAGFYGKRGLQGYPEFPTLEDMRREGLESFHWTRARGGRFSRQEVEHAAIAHVVASNGFDPGETEVLVDAFYTNGEKSRFLLTEYLHRRGFPIPEANVHICHGGDQSVPIINYADLLAFQIGLGRNAEYREFFPGWRDFGFEPHEIAYDEQRVMIPLGEDGRKMLDEVIDSWAAPHKRLTRGRDM